MVQAADSAYDEELNRLVNQYRALREQGRYNEASAIDEKAMQLTRERFGPKSRQVSDLFFGLMQVERDADLKRARRQEEQRWLRDPSSWRHPIILLCIGVLLLGIGRMVQEVNRGHIVSGIAVLLLSLALLSALMLTQISRASCDVRPCPSAEFRQF